MAATLKVTHRNIPQGPFKLRPVCDLVRGKSVAEALVILKLIPRAAAQTLAKKLQATASASIDRSMDPERLVIRAIYCDQQMELKRQRIRSRGRAAIMRKRSSTVTIELAEAAPVRVRKTTTQSPVAAPAATNEA